MRFLIVSMCLVLFVGCGGDNSDTEVQYLPNSKKKILDVDTVGCWLRIKMNNDGTLKEDPWSAFWLREDGYYWQIDAETGRINVDDDLKDDVYTPDKEWANWWEDEKDTISVYAYDGERNITSRSKMVAEGYYSEPARSILMYTEVDETNWSKDETRHFEFRDVIITDIDYKLLLDGDDIHPLCKKLKSLK